MNILDELKQRLDEAIGKRNEVLKRLENHDPYIEYMELQEEIAEVSRAVKALEHSCPNYGMMQARMQYGRGNQ